MTNKLKKSPSGRPLFPKFSIKDREDGETADEYVQRNLEKTMRFNFKELRREIDELIVLPDEDDEEKEEKMVEEVEELVMIDTFKIMTYESISDCFRTPEIDPEAAISPEGMFLLRFVDESDRSKLVDIYLGFMLKNNQIPIDTVANQISFVSDLKSVLSYLIKVFAGSKGRGMRALYNPFYKFLDKDKIVSSERIWEFLKVILHIPDDRFVACLELIDSILPDEDLDSVLEYGSEDRDLSKRVLWKIRKALELA